MTRPKLALVIHREGLEDLRVGGMSLMDRSQRSLSDAGIEDVELVQPSKAVERIGQGDEPLLVVWDDWILEPQVVADLSEQFDEDCPKEVLASGLVVPTREGEPTAPILLLSANAAKQLSTDLLEQGADAVLSFFREQAMPIHSMELLESYWAPVHDQKSAKDALWGLLLRLRWRQGGLIAHYLNRPVSIRMSRYLVHTGISPNQTTIVTFIVGIVAVILMFGASRQNFLIGWALMHFNSVADGIDGELARLRHQSSEFGAYLDSVCDELLNTAVLIAAGYHLLLTTHQGDPTYLYLGIFSGSASLLYAMTHWHCKLKHGLGLYFWFEAYRPRKQVQRSRSAFQYFKRMFQKDGLLFMFMVAAFLNVMEPLMWIASVASASVLVLLFIHVFIKRARW